MTRALARELGSRGITVNCVAPGFIDTDMTAGAARGAADRRCWRRSRSGRLGKPSDIAARGGVPGLARRPATSPGTELHVNGGMFMA